LCISSTKTGKKFGWQQIISGDTNKEIEMMKFQNNNSDKRIIGDIFQISHFSEDSLKEKRACRDTEIEVLTASPCNEEFTTKAAEEQRRSMGSLMALYRELPGVQSCSLRRCTLGTICNGEEDFSHFQFHTLQFNYYKGESNENLTGAIKIRNTAQLSCKLTTMILMV